jgi:hypothetical protein
MSFSLLEISPRLLILFSSRLVMVDPVQSHWGSLAVAADFCATTVAFGLVALAAAVEDAMTFFFPMALRISPSSFGSLGAVAMASRKQGRR